jgi:hypothetical protein
MCTKSWPAQLSDIFMVRCWSEGSQTDEVLQALAFQASAICQVKLLQGGQASEVLQALVCQEVAAAKRNALQGTESTQVFQLISQLQPTVDVSTMQRTLAVTSRTATKVWE